MTSHTTVYKSLVLTIIVVLSVVAGTMGVAGMTTNAGPTHEQQTTNGALSAQIDANLQTGSAKALTISWFRDDGDSNGPYPVPPNEYDGQEAAGIGMFHNAEGDAQLRVDDSTALNPNGQWDMMALHVETDGLDALNPPSDGGDKGLVTQQFLQSDNWSVDITQTNGDKVLNVGDNQDGYENPPGVSADVPPVMVFADTDEVEGDYTVDGGPDTGLYVWIDPNRATLMKNGQEASFEPGDKFKATFHVGDQTDTTTFEMVQGDVTMPDDLSPGNTAQGTISGRSTLAAGTDVEVELSFANGDTMSHTVEVKGNKQIGGDTAATAPQGYVNATFDLTGRENQKFTVDAYAPGPDGGLIDGAPARNDDDYLSEKNRIHVATGSGTVKNVVNSNYTIDNATIYASKMLTIAYHNSAIDPAGLGTQIGDGDATGDFSLAKNTDGHGKFDEAWLLYETNDLSKAIQESPVERGS